MVDFTKLKIAVLATHGFEELQLTEPLRAVRQAGAHVDIVAPTDARLHEPGFRRIQGFHDEDKAISVPVDDYLTLHGVKAAFYDGLILPGGLWNSSSLRVDPDVLQFVQDMHETERPIGAIGSAVWVLISAGLMKGKRVAAPLYVRDDVRSAGGVWSEESPVVDRNWITCRRTMDLPSFNSMLIELLSEPMPMMSAEVRASAFKSRIV